jgi:hypothetical protein
MVYQRPFYLETLTQVDNNTLPFQQHLKATCDLLLCPTCASLPSFDQLIMQQMVQLQDSISEHLRHHTLSSMPIMLKFYHVMAQRWVFGL